MDNRTVTDQSNADKFDRYLKGDCGAGRSLDQREDRQ